MYKFSMTKKEKKHFFFWQTAKWLYILVLMCFVLNVSWTSNLNQTKISKWNAGLNNKKVLFEQFFFFFFFVWSLFVTFVLIIWCFCFGRSKKTEKFWSEHFYAFIENKNKKFMIFCPFAIKIWMIFQQANIKRCIELKLLLRVFFFLI